MIYIGIDPGTHTGVAVWDSGRGKLIEATTKSICDAINYVGNWQIRAKVAGMELMVIFEDARQRTWFGNGDISRKAQGAGSVKRDCSIWEEFLTDKGIQFRAVPPQKGGTKVTPEYFQLLTGYGGRTSSHARDAAMLVIGK